MAKYFKIAFSLFLVTVALAACKKDFPVDEDGLLITGRQECYVSNFEIVGTDFQPVRPAGVTTVIDTTAQTINYTVLFGTDLKNVYPQFTLASDCKLDPKITGKVDFSDLTKPKTWTVISGNRQIRKPYTVIVKYQ
ncbi:MAG: hypothetical protein H0X70_02910 [Segetibacter sp.]|jgi:hypothetical protein|nr:hypothetical protein [Segetibacter sp.]